MAHVCGEVRGLACIVGAEGAGNNQGKVKGEDAPLLMFLQINTLCHTANQVGGGVRFP